MQEQVQAAAATEAPKAYDLKVLVAKLKTRGINVLESEAKGVFHDVFDWTKESAAISKTPVDDIVVGVLTPVVPFIDAQIDKINGKVGA